jgi:hypothetical protein
LRKGKGWRVGKKGEGEGRWRIPGGDKWRKEEGKEKGVAEGGMGDGERSKSREGKGRGRAGKSERGHGAGKGRGETG